MSHYEKGQCKRGQLFHIIPYIPPLFQDNKFIVDFKEKRAIFNSFFAKQCLLLDTGSALPSPFLLIVFKSLSGVDFSMEDSRNILAKSDSLKLTLTIDQYSHT